MIIEITGAGFTNKGAELMLRSAVHEASTWGAGVRFAVNPSVGSYEERAGAGLRQKLDLARLGRLQGAVRRRLPAGYRERYGLVIPEDVDVVLDASGFRYSDQWGAGTSRTLALRTAREWRPGTPYVLLPQALGPFRDPGARAAFADAMTRVSLVFARDEDSYAYVREIMGDDPRLAMSPDFTALLPAVVPDDLPRWAGVPLGAIVPNARMLDKTGGDVGARYGEFLRACVAEVRRAGLQPVVLLHSREAGDGALARELAAGAGGEVPVVEHPDPRVLKGYLGACELVVSSRFHALVSGLSQNVPCVATGWSHKYQRLFHEYGCPEFLVDLSRPLDEALEPVRRLLRPEERARVRGVLEPANARVRAQIRAMWDTVRGVVMPRAGA
jgi:polysaccharide pyruvyl transferase WcaK-like protein